MLPLLRIVAALTLAFSLGLHWGALQLVAWTGMIVTYSRDASLAEAVSKTFDGEHPCTLCLAIQEGRAQEKKQEQQQTKPTSKFDLGLVWQPIQFDFFMPRAWQPVHDLAAPSRVDPPPKPRPKPGDLTPA
ncbi:MAG: hypothetical protein N3I86_07265 [Verrucomicrobiae bacterium]|nr:hypothetical protein [Verrucomicrobiae bacterium]MDW8309135.1 hypothetical protein [Verrucomicrobiales bacterium]